MKAALGGCQGPEHCNPVLDVKKYPWGNEDPDDCSMANFSWYGSCVGFYQTVGAYPEGQSPYGMMEAFGNAKEWLKSMMNEDGTMAYPYIVVRGGQALNNAVYYHFNPDTDPGSPPGPGTVGGRCARDP